ncbi:condensation domain-containing protein [Paenibacillus dauci]|uniref:condensation domain-containing protein n=1 Tax=Paenibacillus dauci TaxID=1567106 RepID=UPI00061970E4|nr:condensation domain-containing protein [Paenibacillus dauci]
MLEFKDIDFGTDDLEVDIKETAAPSRDIAVIGMSFRLPGAETIEQFWDLLSQGQDCISTIPETRKELLDRYYNWKEGALPGSYTEMAYLPEIDKFDHSFFGISPKEASLMDPNQRIFLELAWQAIEDSGYGGDLLKGSQTGVYCGFCQPVVGTYMDMIKNVDSSLIAQGMIGNMPSMIPSRIGYFMDFHGPSFFLDTACSSSLVAIHQAVQGLRSGDCSLAIAGSTELVIFPTEMEQKMGIESTSNRTRSFDDDSDGTGAGEGAVVLVLKLLQQAIEDNDQIYSVIKGTAINQDGNSIGLTAPNPAAQQNVIIEAWKDGNINPEHISYIEAHGTATNLGDPIEIEGITNAFRQYTSKKQFCALSALKSNIGHLGAAAGIAGVLKGIVSLQYKQIPPIVHLGMPNSKIDFENSPVYPNDMLRDWNTQSEMRNCGVSSFGLSGTNCHIVLQQAPAVKQAVPKPANHSYLLTISAKSITALHSLVESYIEKCEQEDSLSIADLCYTSNKARGHYHYRIAITGQTIQQLLLALRNVQTGEHVHITYPPSAETVTKMNISVALYRQQQIKDSSLLEEIARLYMEGGMPDWDQLYKDEQRVRVRLPVYPFDRVSCWLDIPAEAPFSTAELSSGNKIEPVHKQVKLTGRSNGMYSRLEQIIADSWGTALGYAQLDIDDNYFSLGGDSVISLQIVNDIGLKIGCHVLISDLLNHAKLEDMADALEQKIVNDAPVEVLNIPKADEQPYYLLSPAQRRMYITSMLEGAGTAYNIYGACELRGRLDYAKLQRTLNELIKRHEMFRTSFAIVDGEPVQIVQESANIEIKIKQADSNHPNIKEIAEAFIRPFDLNCAPLLRCELLAIDEQHHILLFDIHHIISDGHSQAVFIEEFMRIYNGDILPAINLHYKDFAVWQNDKLKADRLEEYRSYWKEIFKQQLPVLNLPFDYAKPSGPYYEGDAVNAVIGSDMLESMLLQARSFNTTLYNVLLTAYNIMLMKVSGQYDIVIGSASSGREHKDCEQMIGMFVNMLPMRNYPAPHKTFEQLLGEVTSNSVKTFDYQAYPMEYIINDLNLDRGSKQTSLFDVTFTFQNFASSELKLNQLTVKTVDFDLVQAPYALSLIVYEAENELKLNFEYQKAVFKKETVEELAHQFMETLRFIMDHSGELLDNLKLTSLFHKADTAILEQEDTIFHF